MIPPNSSNESDPEPSSGTPVGSGRLLVVDHPLVDHKISKLRRVDTDSATFRTVCGEVTVLTAYEALRHLPTQRVEVQTPLTTTQAPVLSGPAPALIGVLRAGLVMVEAMLTLLPQAKVGHLGLQRDSESHKPTEYYCTLPLDLDQRQVLLVDPMLATGGSAAHAIDVLVNAGADATNIHLLSIIGCPEGVAAVHERHPQTTITLAALDNRLNDDAYIVPGLGDAGDRIYGT